MIKYLLIFLLLTSCVYADVAGFTGDTASATNEADLDDYLIGAVFPVALTGTSQVCDSIGMYFNAYTATPTAMMWLEVYDGGWSIIDSTDHTVVTLNGNKVVVRFPLNGKTITDPDSVRLCAQAWNTGGGLIASGWRVTSGGIYDYDAAHGSTAPTAKEAASWIRSPNAYEITFWLWYHEASAPPTSTSKVIIIQ